jgi:uncharacterized integral membrane protein
MKGFNFSNFSDKFFVRLALPAAVVMLYSIIIGVLLSGLVVYHIWLAFECGTTQENLRNKYTTWGGNPYN